MISLWKSAPNKKTDYNGKVQWADDIGEIDFQDDTNSRLVFFTKKETKDGADYLSGSIMSRDKDGNLRKEHDAALFLNDSENEKAPVLTGKAGDEMRIAVWSSNSSNERAPIFRGNIQALEGAFQPNSKAVF